jgi:hypothetical protein
MSVNEEHLGRMVTLRTADGQPHKTGQMVCYCPVPSVTINLLDGTQAHWRADMCGLSSPEDLEAIAIQAITEKRTS